MICNGIGYDQWVSDTLNASPSNSRKTLAVSQFLGLRASDNRNQRYSLWKSLSVG